MTVKSLTLKAAREKAQKLQDDLGTVFAEAKTDDGQYDYNKVEFFGAELKGKSIDVAKRVKELDSELNEVMEHVETLQGAEEAAKSHGNREKALRGFVLPGGGGGSKGGREPDFKSIGEMATETKSFQDWLAKGCPDGVTITLDVNPSDMLAGALDFNTMGGAKALMSTGAGYAPQSIRQPGYLEAVTRPIQMLDIIPTFRTSQPTVKYMEETTRVHGAAEVAEGGAYAESQFVFTEKEAPVRKIGDSLPVTDEQLEDEAMMQGYVTTRLPFGVRQRLDGQTIVGNGTAPNLRGLKNVAGTQTQAKGADPVPDAFYKGMTKVRLVGRAIATHHVMHPTNWEGIRLLRTVDGVYIWGSPSEAGPDRLWGLPVVQSDADAAGTGYVGSFRPDTVSLHEKRGIDIQFGFVGTQFVEGKRTVRVDTRVALVWWRPPAFCSITGL